VQCAEPRQQYLLHESIAYILYESRTRLNSRFTNIFNIVACFHIPIKDFVVFQHFKDSSSFDCANRSHTNNKRHKSNAETHIHRYRSPKTVHLTQFADDFDSGTPITFSRYFLLFAQRNILTFTPPFDVVSCINIFNDKCLSILKTIAALPALTVIADAKRPVAAGLSRPQTAYAGARPQRNKKPARTRAGIDRA